MSTWSIGALAPRPGAAPLGRMLVAQTKAELTLLLRNGEQLLLVAIIPLGLLLVMAKVDVVNVTGDRVAFLVPGIMALALMSTAFTGQAIAIGFERQYGVLKRLGATPLPRSVLLGAKTLAVLAVELGQLLLIAGLGLLLGWDPHGSFAGVLLLVVLGTAAFSGLGLLLGGTLRGLTTLAAANLIWFVMLVVGGVLFPPTEFDAAKDVLQLLPTAALSHGLREVLQNGASAPARDVVALAGWSVASLAAASRFFRWE